MSHKPYMEKWFSSNSWWTHVLLSVCSKPKSAVLCKADSHTLGTYSVSGLQPLGHHVRQSELASHTCCDSLDALCGLQFFRSSKYFARYQKWSFYQRLCSNAQQVPIVSDSSSQWYAVHGKKTSVLVAEISQKQGMWIALGGECLVTLGSFSSVMKVCSNFTTCDQSKPSFALPSQFLL